MVGTCKYVESFHQIHSPEHKQLLTLKTFAECNEYV